MSRLSEALDGLTPRNINLIAIVESDVERAIKEFADMRVQDRDGVIVLRNTLNKLIKDTQ